MNINRVTEMLEFQGAKIEEHEYEWHVKEVKEYLRIIDLQIVAEEKKLQTANKVFKSEEAIFAPLFGDSACSTFA